MSLACQQLNKVASNMTFFLIILTFFLTIKVLLKRSVPSGNIIPTTSLLGDSPTQYIKIGIFVILFWDRIIKSAFKLSVFNEALPEAGGPMSPVWILKRLVSVFINACRLLSALPSLSQFGQGRLSLVAISFFVLSLLFGRCCLSEFTLAGPL